MAGKAKNDSTDDKINIAVMGTNVQFIKNELGDLKIAIEALDKKISTNYVTQEEFKPVKAVAYGIILVISTGVLGALLSLVLRK